MKAKNVVGKRGDKRGFSGKIHSRLFQIDLDLGRSICLNELGRPDALGQILPRSDGEFVEGE
ncbi:MAG: hypothetical protein DMG24_17520 [Acidobacteria bacterium]|nr:MAG: hypothetical protein DMG24_17520 [Acidobacteriota bacterium]